MKTKPKWKLVVFLVIATAVCVACGLFIFSSVGHKWQSPQAVVVGIWRSVEYSFYFVFNGDGTGVSGAGEGNIGPDGFTASHVGSPITWEAKAWPKAGDAVRVTVVYPDNEFREGYSMDLIVRGGRVLICSARGEFKRGRSREDREWRKREKEVLENAAKE